MVKKLYDEVSVVRTLNKNRGVNIESNRISVDNSTGTVGNNTWGKIDYLCNVHRYVVVKNENGNNHSNRKHYSPKIVNLNKKDTVVSHNSNPKVSNMMVNITKMAMKNSLHHN